MRAFSAQDAMQNTADKFDGLGGIHRPGGLHRLMNFTLVSCNIVVLQLISDVSSEFFVLFLFGCGCYGKHTAFTFHTIQSCRDYCTII